MGVGEMRISVIIPGYNTKKECWQRCVASVQRAIGPDDEIIVVDDGSIVPVEANWFDSAVTLIRQDNQGLGAARNAGMRAAKGRYITFVDSDDEVRSETYDRTVAEMMKTGSDIGLFGVNVIWVEENLQKHDVPRDEYLGKLRPGAIAALLKECLFNYACNKVYSVDFITEHGSAWNNFLFDSKGMPCEDLIFNLNFVMAGAKWCTVDYEGYVYYRTGGTLLSNYKPTNRDGLYKAAKAWQDYCTFDSEASAKFGSRAGVSEIDLQRSDWDNIWRPGTPYSLSARWNWLKSHPVVGSRIEFLKKLLYAILRRHCYFVALRRWHIKRLYPEVENV